MRQQGRLTDWNDDRGFGFITPLSGESTVFVHVSEFPRGQRRPIVTDLVSYVVKHDNRGRAGAQGVLFLAPTHARPGQSLPALRPLPPWVLGVSFAFMFLVFASAVLGVVPWVVPAVYGTMSVATFFAYGLDKLAAEKHRWRTAESTLHLLSAVGGWPGALVAQRYFHHKTIKRSFRKGFWFTVALNLGILGWFVFVAPMTSSGW
jgi:uncharacterized membrane protein YsdA (DUF1294 family)/cold shock CspA family protein